MKFCLEALWWSFKNLHCSNNQTTVSWQQRYSQVNDNFLKSDHPAVARTKPRLSSPFPIANPAFGSPSPSSFSFPPDPYNQSPSPGEFRQEADSQEGITSYNEYIIPIPDPKPEEVFTNMPSESPARYRAADLSNAGAVRKMRMYLLNKRSVFSQHTPTHPDVELRQ